MRLNYHRGHRDHEGESQSCGRVLNAEVAEERRGRKGEQSRLRRTIQQLEQFPSNSSATQTDSACLCDLCVQNAF